MRNKPQEFLDKYSLVSTGTAKVPLLEYNDDIIVESEDVTRYIAANVPGEELVSGGISVERFLYLWHPVVDKYYSILTAGSEMSVNEAMDQFVGDLALLNSLLKDSEGPFLLGESFSVAECIAAPWVQRFFVTLLHYRSIDFDDILKKNQLEKTASWMKAVRERPSVVESKCCEDEMLAAAKCYYISYVTPGALCKDL